MGRPKKIVTETDTETPAPSNFAEGPKPQPTSSKVSSLAELSAIVDKPLLIEFDWMGSLVQIEARRLRPAESAILSEMMDEAVPPVIKGRTMDEDRPDYGNVDFIKKKAQVGIEARAMALYWCVKMFSDAKPGLSNRKEITEFIQSQLSESVLRAMWNGVSHPVIEKSELVNFT
jgi:hypothetical protein